MKRKISLQNFLFVATGVAFVIGSVIVKWQDHRDRTALRTMLQSEGFWNEDQNFACFPLAHTQSYRSHALLVRIRPGTRGILRITHCDHSTGKLDAREISVNATPRFELILSVIKSPATPHDPDAKWVVSTDWFGPYSLRKPATKVLFTGDEEVMTVLRMRPRITGYKSGTFVGSLFLVHSNEPGVFSAENLAQVQEVCNQKGWDAISVEYFRE